jgi:hypothetical protein
MLLPLSFFYSIATIQDLPLLAGWRHKKGEKENNLCIVQRMQEFSKEIGAFSPACRFLKRCCICWNGVL